MPLTLQLFIYHVFWVNVYPRKGGLCVEMLHCCNGNQITTPILGGKSTVGWLYEPQRLNGRWKTLHRPSVRNSVIEAPGKFRMVVYGMTFLLKSDWPLPCHHSEKNSNPTFLLKPFLHSYPQVSVVSAVQTQHV